MAKNKFDHNPKPIANLANAVGDVGRVIAINKALKDYQFYNKYGHTIPTPAHYLLAQLLGVDQDWINYFDAVCSGRLYGNLLIGGEDHSATILSQAILSQRFGLVENPVSKKPEIAHPKMLADREALNRYAMSRPKHKRIRPFNNFKPMWWSCATCGSYRPRKLKWHYVRPIKKPAIYRPRTSDYYNQHGLLRS